MDEKLIAVVKNETHLINCPKCGGQIKFVTQDMGDRKRHVYEFQHKMLKKFENHETLYLRDTSESTKENYPYLNDIIKALRYNDSLKCYVMEVRQTDKPFQMTERFVIELIRGTHASRGYEIIDIYGNTNK